MATPSIQTLITQAQQVLNLKSSNEIRATLAAVLANANVGTPLNPNLTTQQLWDEFYEIVRQPSDDIMSIITDQMMRFVYAPPAPGGAGADKQVIFNDGGVLAGDTKFLWDKNANRLDVDGPVVVTGLATLASATITGNLTVDTNTLFVDAANNRVGMGTATPGFPLDLNGTGSTTPFRLLSNVGTNIRFDTTRSFVTNRNWIFGCDQFDEGVFALAPSTTLGGSTFTNPVYKVSNDGIHTFLDGAGGTRMTLNATGLGIANGNVILSTSGKGIDFSATAGTGTSELLNDYEEGAWTPVFQGTASNGTYVYSAQVGRYTKVGNLVTVFGNLVISSITTAATGVMRIGGLPFTTSSVNVYAAATVGWTDLITISSGTLALSVNVSGVVIDMYRILSGAGVGFITPSDLVVNTRINFTATYFV